MQAVTGVLFSKHTFDQMFPSYPLQPTDIKLKSLYWWSIVYVFDSLRTIPVSYNEQTLQLLFVVAGTDGPSLLAEIGFMAYVWIGTLFYLLMRTTVFLSWFKSILQYSVKN